MLKEAIERMNAAYEKWNMVNGNAEPHIESAAWFEYVAARTYVEALVIDEKLKTNPGPYLCANQREPAHV